MTDSNKSRFTTNSQLRFITANITNQTLLFYDADTSVTIFKALLITHVATPYENSKITRENEGQRPRRTSKTSKLDGRLSPLLLICKNRDKRRVEWKFKTRCSRPRRDYSRWGRNEKYCTKTNLQRSPRRYGVSVSSNLQIFTLALLKHGSSQNVYFSQKKDFYFSSTFIFLRVDEPVSKLRE